MEQNESEISHPVPVVRLIIADAAGRILILRRQKSRYMSGAWCLPGGKIDYGDSAEKTVIKELQEEASLTCVSSKFLFYQDSLPIEKGAMHCINMYFECAVSGEVVLNEESGEYKWMAPSALAEHKLAFRNDLAVERYLKEKEAGR